MHEFSLVNEVMLTLDNLARYNGWKRVESVTLSVGSMRQVVPHVMEFAFSAALELLDETSALKQARLKIERIPFEAVCAMCGKRWGEEHAGLLCPFCGSSDTTLEHGMELDIDSVEVNDDDSED